jgi:hypothetical protein
VKSSPFTVESGYLEVHRTLENLELSEIRLKERKFDKCGCKLFLSVLYNMSIIICTYFVGMFNRVSSFVRRVNASKLTVTWENEIIECATTKDHRH